MHAYASVTDRLFNIGREYIVKAIIPNQIKLIIFSFSDTKRIQKERWDPFYCFLREL